MTIKEITYLVYECNQCQRTIQVEINEPNLPIWYKIITPPLKGTLEPSHTYDICSPSCMNTFINTNYRMSK